MLSMQNNLTLLPSSSSNHNGQSPPPKSFLKDIPPEIRLQIYEHALVRTPHADRRFCTHTRSPPAPELLALSLLRACKQIYFEAFPILYTHTRFHIRCPSPLDPKCATLLLKDTRIIRCPNPDAYPYITSVIDVCDTTSHSNNSWSNLERKLLTIYPNLQEIVIRSPRYAATYIESTLHRDVNLTKEERQHLQEDYTKATDKLKVRSSVTWRLDPSHPKFNAYLRWQHGMRANYDGSRFTVVRAVSRIASPGSTYAKLVHRSNPRLEDIMPQDGAEDFLNKSAT